jgi:hypothetical protein
MVRQIVVALSYKPKAPGLYPQRGHWNSQQTSSYQPHYGPGFESGSNRYEYKGTLWRNGLWALKVDHFTATCGPIV